jgi:hypothetical protein
LDETKFIRILKAILHVNYDRLSIRVISRLAISLVIDSMLAKARVGRSEKQIGAVIFRPPVSAEGSSQKALAASQLVPTFVQDLNGIDDVSVLAVLVQVKASNVNREIAALY